MYHVLHDFTFFIKGSGYVTAAIIMILFVAFWYYVTGRESKRR